MIRLLAGDCRSVLATLPDASVHCVVTSPPYYGLRDYGTAQWDGGDAQCSHTQQRRVGASTLMNDGRAQIGLLPDHKYTSVGNPYRDICGKCGATRVDRQIGLEKSPEDYLATMVQVFREVRRVLRPDGTVWCNLGDSFVNKQLQMMPARVALALQADGWFVRSDIIWCLSGGTRVYARTQKGEAPMSIKDMVRLDPATVQLWTGQRWTQVLGWNETLRPDRTYEIELRNGQRIGCTGNHEWPVEPAGNIRADELKVGDIIRRCRLPEPVEPRSPSWLMDELAGWFVGIYIAEGSRHDGTINIASHSDETARFERLAAIAAALDGYCAVHKISDNGSTVALNGPMLWGLIDTYVSGELASGKHLHPRCWQRSDDFLRAVLNGYLAGDGHYDEGNDRWRLGFCTNDELVADLRTIGARLGVSVRLRRVMHQLAGREFPGYRGELRFQRSGHFNNRDDGEIVAIRESRARKFWDIGVEDAEHLFALASGVLTHNSKPNPMPESCTDRPTSAHEHVFLLTRSKTYYYDADAVREEAEYGRGTDPSGRMFQRVGNGTTSVEHLSGAKGHTHEGGRNLRNVWTIATHAYSAAHFATFPPELASRCIRAGTSERGCCAQCGAPWRRVVERQRGPIADVLNPKDVARVAMGLHGDKMGLHQPGWRQHIPASATTTGWSPSCTHGGDPVPCTVLDCFAGAGTTLMVADRLQRDAIGIELSPDYTRMAMARCQDDAPLFAAFPVADPAEERQAELWAVPLAAD